MNDAQKPPPRVIVGIDIETSGLNRQECGILEIHARSLRFDHAACGFVADGDLDFHTYAFGPYTWEAAALEMHLRSGLLHKAVAASVHETQALTALADALGKLCAARGVGHVHLLGSSVHFDREFILAREARSKLSRGFDRLMRHRLLDVSAVHLFLDAIGFDVAWPEKDRAHTAVEDLEETLTEANAAAVELLGVLEVVEEVCSVLESGVPDSEALANFRTRLSGRS